MSWLHSAATKKKNESYEDIMTSYNNAAAANQSRASWWNHYDGLNFNIVNLGNVNDEHFFASFLLPEGAISQKGLICLFAFFGSKSQK